MSLQTVLTAAVLAFSAVAANAGAQEVVKLERVVVTGKAVREVAQLPRVIVTGHAQRAETQVVAILPRVVVTGYATTTVAAAKSF